MIPKNHKLFIKPTVTDTNQSEVLVTDIVEFFYSELRKSLNEIDSINIKVDCLGTFKVKTKDLHKLKTKLEGQLGSVENPETFNQMRVKKEVEQRLKKVYKTIDILSKEQQRKTQVKQKRNEKNKGDLEK